MWPWHSQKQQQPLKPILRAGTSDQIQKVQKIKKTVRPKNDHMAEEIKTGWP